MTSKVKLVSQALVLLGAQSISSLDDGSSGGQVASLLFDTCYEALLTETRWHFATKFHRMSQKIVSDNPNYNSSFMLPADCLYVIEADTDYEIHKNKVYAQTDDVSILYIFKPEIDQLPAYFTAALELKLASQFAVPITADLNKTQLYASLAQDQLKKARFADSSSRTVSIIKDSPYTQVR